MTTPDDWDAASVRMASAAPAFAEAFKRFRAVPMTSMVIERKYKELMLVAANASVTLLHGGAVRHHMRNAMEAGADAAEILETLELASVIGIHTCSTGMPILLEELAAIGAAPSPELDAVRLATKRDFIATRGWWSDYLEAMVQLQPDLLSAYLEFSAVPWQRGRLPAKIKEFIYIAIDSQTTHLYESGLRSHIRNALKLGATASEITEVFATLSGLGVHAMMLGVPELLALEAEGSDPNQSKKV